MAPPKKWEDEDETSSEEESSDESVGAQQVAIRKKFDDEEDSDDVADDWEADDSEEERKKASAAAAAKAKAEAEALKNKKSKKERIEEHREANRLKKLQEDPSDDSDEDEADKRARLRRSEQDADLRHAEDLLTAGDGPKSRGQKPIVVKQEVGADGTVDLTKIPLFRPATKTQFEQLSEVLVPLLRGSSSKPHYAIWVSNFCKQICADLPSSEIKKAASALTALSNERMKEEKEKEKGGKKSKAAKTKVSAVMGRDTGRGGVDTQAYDDDGLGDDDFM